MVIDKIILHDFGVYAGRQEVDLTPRSVASPIVLFGGLNGTGKTTLLDALKLCLFGPAAKCSNRKGLGYYDYLEHCINKRAIPKEAAVGLDFRHTVDGRESSYHLRRNWHRRGGKVSEDFSVSINGFPAETITKNWLQHIEEIMPANIAHLFFFDGEQAEEYATSENSTALVQTAILNLLGLDIVNQLDKDLLTLERRINIAKLDEKRRNEITELEKTIGALKDEMDALYQKRAELQTHGLDRKIRERSDIEERFKKIGGDLYERRADIEAHHKAAKENLDACERSLRELSESCLPLSLVLPLLNALEQRDEEERNILDADNKLSGIEGFSGKLLDHLAENGVARKTINLINTFSESETKNLRNISGKSVENPIDYRVRVDLLSLKDEKIEAATAAAKKLSKEHQELLRKADESTIELASIPQPDDLKDILNERDATAKDIAVIEGDIAKLDEQILAARHDMARQESNLQSLVVAYADQQIEQEEQGRILQHSTKARNTLLQFKNQVICRHIKRIEQLVLESYQSLLRKESLIEHVSIDTETFRVSLYDADRVLVAPERLSAGERQLLSISMVWGMAKASGRPLPTAIDTPLGRLDSSHRKRLVQRYFPNASHQVLLFSTDEELQGDHIKSLGKRIGRNYRLDHDDRTGGTKIAEGYLQ